jgi:thiol-disulfide isomerase/thioredoxin
VWIGIVAVVSILAIAVFTVQSGNAGGGNFEMTAYQGASTLGGTNVDFDQVKREAAGKPIVLNFWGGSCPPCRAEMPGFERAFQRNKDDFVMLGLDVGPFFGLGTQNSAFALLQELNITYPAASANSRTAVSEYGATALPSTFFFDGEGNLVGQRIGFMDEATFESILKNLIDDVEVAADTGDTPHTANAANTEGNGDA